MSKGRLGRLSASARCPATQEADIEDDIPGFISILNGIDVKVKAVDAQVQRIRDIQDEDQPSQ